MDYGIISCIPIAVLIIGVLITKRMAEMIILASLIGAILVHKGDFFSGYIGMMYGALSNPSYQFLLIILLGFGGMTKLFEKSGSLMGIGNALSKYADSPKKSMGVTWLVGIIMFVDDYLNVLATSFSMRTLTDRNGVPREHLAYGVNSMGACVCVLIPFTSWAAFAVGTISEQGLGFNDYVRSIPYMFFPWIAIIVCLLVAIGVIPKVGLIKKAYERVAAGGPVLLEEKAGASLVNIEVDENAKPTSPLNFIVPIIVLIAAVLIFENDVIHGIIAALVVQAIMYIAQRIMTLEEYMGTLFEGISSMAPLAVVISFAYVLGSANDAMGFAPYVIGVMTKAISPQLLPAFAFIVVALVAFAAASFWVLIIITVPIFIPLSVSMGVDPAIIVAGIMSGVAFGSKFCFYSDAVFMTSAGTGISNMTQIKAVAPYVLGSAVLAILFYLAVGFITV
jgi:tetracycline resistance efflux pump